ncbi:hypothetical protein HD554DRAFT_2036178 [Boletus coccyginus]|nr:hypothetical protein HD554DRAFT_2036178 [Boletus coccyginus]
MVFVIRARGASKVGEIWGVRRPLMGAVKFWDEGLWLGIGSLPISRFHSAHLAMRNDDFGNAGRAHVRPPMSKIKAIEGGILKRSEVASCNQNPVGSSIMLMLTMLDILSLQFRQSWHSVVSTKVQPKLR